MKIKTVKTFFSGGWVHAGALQEVDESRGKELVRNGLAEEVQGEAVAKQPATAAKAASQPANKQAHAPANKGR